MYQLWSGIICNLKTNKGEVVKEVQIFSCKKIIQLLSLIFLIHLAEGWEGINSEKDSGQLENNLKILLFAPIPPLFVMDHIDFWADSSGFDGFIIGNIAEYYSSKSELESKRQSIEDFNYICMQNGMGFNFLKIAIGYRTFPLWTDTVAIKKQLEQFSIILQWAKEVGFYGLAIDTEPYSTPLWDPNTDRFDNIPLEILSNSIFHFGQKLGELIGNTNEGLQLMLLLEGVYLQNVYNKGYNLWYQFVNGLTSANLNRVILSCESSYKRTNLRRFENYYLKLVESINDELENPDKLQLSFGAYPLGYYKKRVDKFTDGVVFLNKDGKLMKNGYADKRSNYDVEKFRNQLKMFKDYSSNWMWVYGHGAAWWQLDTTKYRTIWNKVSQSIPPDSSINRYFQVVRDIKNY